MSILHYYNDTSNSPNTPKIWNNAAFDDPSLGSDGLANAPSWSVLQPISINRLDLFESDLNKPTKAEIEKEIVKTEKEIERLNRRLEELRSKKASLSQKHGRVVPYKFKEAVKIKFETPVNNKWRQRGVSLGPLEIQHGSAQSSKKPNSKKIEEIKQQKGRSQPRIKEEAKIQFEATVSNKLRQRGVSLGPLEIRQGAAQSSKKPNSKKLEELKEEKGKSQPCKSVGPKIVSGSRPSRRGVSLGPTEISAISRKTPSKPVTKLEKIEEKSVSNRRLSRGPRQPRVIPSRYSLAPAKFGMGSNCDAKKSPSSITKIAMLLPKIKAVRCTEQSPRDSGRARRVAELIGKKPFFPGEEGEEGVSSYREMFED